MEISRFSLRVNRARIISEISIKPGVTANPDANPPVQVRAAIRTTGATFQINNAKLLFRLLLYL